MRYGILGATGPLGLALLEQLKEQQVGVYVRNPSKLPAGIQATVTQGDLQDKGKLQAWAEQHDVVLCALGHTSYLAQLKANLGLGVYPQRTMLQDVVNILLGSKLARLVYCSAYGTGDTEQDLPFVFGKFALPLLLRQTFNDHQAVEQALTQGKHQLAWVVARPTMLSYGPATGKYDTFDRAADKHSGKISRADVAHFMIQAAQQPTYLGKLVGLSDLK